MSGPREILSSTETSGTVLVIDDEPLVLAAARRVLERSGYRVLTALGGREGVAVFRENARAVSAVLLDVSMPDLSGSETFTELRRIDGRVPIVLTSGYGESVAARDFPAGQVAGFVPKPYLPRELVQRVEESLA